MNPSGISSYVRVREANVSWSTMSQYMNLSIISNYFRVREKNVKLQPNIRRYEPL
jgi:hypothetical protein